MKNFKNPIQNDSIMIVDRHENSSEKLHALIITLLGYFMLGHEGMSMLYYQYTSHY